MRRPFQCAVAAIAGVCVLAGSVMWLSIARSRATAPIDTTVAVRYQAVPAPPAVPATPVPWSGGGSYGGPGDTVPPGPGPGTCSNPGLLGCGWPCFCPTLYRTSHNYGCAPSCACDVAPQAHATEGWDITFGDLVAFLGDSTCSPPDGNGNVSMCIGQFDDVCEVNAFISTLLVATGPPPTVPALTVPVQVCVDGNVLSFPTTQPLGNSPTQKWTGCLDCGTVEVKIVFNRQCMQDAIIQWIRFWINTIPNWNYTMTYGQWAIHIGVVKCGECDF